MNEFELTLIGTKDPSMMETTLLLTLDLTLHFIHKLIIILSDWKIVAAKNWILKQFLISFSMKGKKN